MDKEKNNICDCVITILSSLLLAAGISAVFFSGLIPSILTLIIITLIFGILGIVFLIFSIFCNNRLCNCISKSNLVTSSVGAIISSAFALSITSLATFSVTVAILIGVVAFFLALTIITLLNTLICLFCRNNSCCYKE